MADNVDITSGTGTTVATDEITGVHYQKVKIALGAADSATLLSSGAGAVDSGTQRVTTASNDPIVTAITSSNTKLDTLHTDLGTLGGYLDGVETLIGTSNTSLSTIAGKDFSTQTTLAAVLAKIIAAPATEAKQDTGNTSLSTIAGKDFATQTTLASLLAKVIAAPATEAKQDTQITAFGGVTETAPASDTASSGLNGRLQRIAQRLTSLIALLPTALGAGGGLKVDGSGTALPVSGTVALSGTSTVSGTVSITDISAAEYETVAASATNQALGATGATGDYLAGVLIIPATTSPGAVTIKDGSNSAITIFTGGATSVSNLVPFMVPLGIKSTSGAWQVTTNTNVSAIGIGNFT